jgi:hypothetical protein
MERRSSSFAIRLLMRVDTSIPPARSFDKISSGAPLPARFFESIFSFSRIIRACALLRGCPQALPVAAIFRHRNRLTNNWSLSGTTRFATGFPVTPYDNSDDSLLGTLGNGANNYLLDTPQFTPGPLHINTNGRNGLPAFNKILFAEETLGQLGNAKRRIFYGPGTENYDMTLEKGVRVTESKTLTLRMEGFNIFNHAQFYGRSLEGRGGSGAG